MLVTMSVALRLIATCIIVVVNAVIVSARTFLPTSVTQLTSTALTNENLAPLKCKSICGVRKVAGPQNGTDMLPLPPIALDDYRNGTQLCGSLFSDWQEAAYNLTLALNLDDGIYSSWCQYRNPNRDDVRVGGNETIDFLTEPSHLVSVLERNLGLQHRPSQELKVAVREAQCTIQVFRGLFEQTGYSTKSIDAARTYWMPAVFAESSGAIFQVLDQTNGSALSFRVPKSRQDNCTRSTCTSFSTLWLPSASSPYSLYAEFEPEQVPGIEIAYSRLVGDISIANAVSEDTSPSNIAIIALPLLISLPPISLFDNVSGWLTLWYWVVTDIFAAVPTLIKGIELIVVHQAKVDTLATFARHAGRFGVFETWYSKCEIPTEKAHSKIVTGWVLIAVALSFILISTSIEIFYWQHKKRKWKRNLENDVPLLGSSENDHEIPLNITAEIQESKYTPGREEALS